MDLLGEGPASFEVDGDGFEVSGDGAARPLAGRGWRSVQVLRADLDGAAAGEAGLADEQNIGDGAEGAEVAASVDVLGTRDELG